jgi:sugar phosphate isomerase/epimerase
MNILGFSTGMYGWNERYWLDYKKEASWEDIFRDCAEAGVDAVELDPSPNLVKLAKSFGLSVSSAYVGLQLHEAALDVEKDIMPVARRLSEAGGKDLVVNADPKGGWGVSLPKTEDEFKRQGDHLSQIAIAAGTLGLKVSMHNHADDKHNAEGDLRSVIEYSSPEVGLCIDTGWAYAAGYDPIEWIQKYPDRLHTFHLRNQKGRIPTEDLIDGDINMRKLIHVLKDIRYTGWLTLELWHREDNHPQRTMVEDTRISIDYLKQMIREIE